MATRADIRTAAQRDWHIRGQNRCVFARLAARSADTMRWNYIVVDTEATNAELSEVGDVLEQAVRADRAEVVSLLFPSVLDASASEGLIRQLVCTSSFWLDRDEAIDNFLRMYLRYPVPASSGLVQAWVMALVHSNGCQTRDEVRTLSLQYAHARSQAIYFIDLTKIVKLPTWPTCPWR